MRATHFVLIFSLSVLLLLGTLHAQNLATLKVTVTDPTGAVIPGVTVSVTNTETGAKRTDVTE